ncbi:hypothetical protein MCEL_07390 [Mycolicibacterium celeriflavum]|uniref:Uncharacterized protein n=1 Tax=Mycolicibacterium celeriflavum TaxID=1249101 RepID=A0A7I7RD27_MYCCF|nr:hypothetical protein MCEL_07390 [Mycolicibacterium celeriflavum]
MQPVATIGGKRLGPQHRRRGLIGGLSWRGPTKRKNLDGIAVDGRAVGILSFDEDKADSRSCHRQAQYGVHTHPFGRPSTAGDRNSKAHRRLRRAVASGRVAADNWMNRNVLCRFHPCKHRLFPFAKGPFAITHDQPPGRILPWQGEVPWQQSSRRKAHPAAARYSGTRSG